MDIQAPLVVPEELRVELKPEGWGPSSPGLGERGTPVSLSGDSLELGEGRLEAQRPSMGDLAAAL